MRAADYETYLIRPGLVAPKPVVMSVTENEGAQAALLPPANAANWWRALCSSGETIATANGCFDLGVAVKDDSLLLGRVFEMLRRGQVKDTHLRQPLLDIGRGTLLVGASGQQLSSYSLSNICEKVLGERLAKENTPRLYYARLDGVPFELWTDEEREYSRKDALKTYAAVKKQGEGEPDDPGILNLALEDYEMRAAWALHLMSCWGPRTDPEMVADVTREVTQAHEAAIAKFTAHGIYRGEGWCRREKQCEGRPPHKFLQTPGNPGWDCWRPWLPSKIGSRDGEVLKTLVSEAYNGQPPRTESGDVSTDRDTLMESGSDLLVELAEVGTNETEFRTYLDVIARGATAPICVRYDPIKKTARVGARDPNLQNLPRGGRTRECFVPRDFRHPDRAIRTVYCSTDYPSLELWTLAENLIDMLGDHSLADMLRRGDDVHCRLAGVLEGLTYEEALRRKKAKDPRIVNLRQAAKPINYGMGGGMGAEKLTSYCRQPSNGGIKFCAVEGLPCGEEKYVSEKNGKVYCRQCVEIAARYRQGWFAMLPAMRDYFEMVAEESESGIVQVLAPEGLPPLYCAGRTFSEAANLKFQGRAARAAKDALWRVAVACYDDEKSPMYGCRPTIFAHDEIITECPEVLAHEAGFEQARLMGEALATWCPKAYNDKACPEPALMRRWFKKAEKVFDKGGRLMPWWPDDWDWKPDAEIQRNDLARAASKG